MQHKLEDEKNHVWKMVAPSGHYSCASNLSSNIFWVTWMSWGLKPLATQLLFNNLFNLIAKKTLKLCTTDGRILLTKGYLMQKMFPCQEVLWNIDSWVQDCSISIALAMEILQSCTKPLVCCFAASIQCMPRHVHTWNIPSTSHKYTQFFCGMVKFCSNKN